MVLSLDRNSGPAQFELPDPWPNLELGDSAMPTVLDSPEPSSVRPFRFRLRLRAPTGGTRWADVLDESDQVIGSAHDRPYPGYGFAVHTREFAGFVADASVDFVSIGGGR